MQRRSAVAGRAARGTPSRSVSLLAAACALQRLPLFRVATLVILIAVFVVSVRSVEEVGEQNRAQLGELDRDFQAIYEGRQR